MRLLLIGLVVGGLSGFAVQKYVLADDASAARREREAPATTRLETPEKDSEAVTDRDSLLARIRDLEARLAALGEDGGQEDLFGGVEVPTTEEGIVNLLEQWHTTNDLDQLLALIKALLLQGEKGYPRLTRVLMRLVGKATSGKIKEEEVFRKVVPALKVAMSHEKELVGYVGYLITSDRVLGDVRTAAMGAAMFLSINRVEGSEKFGPVLLEAFMKGGGGGLFGGDENQQEMLIQAMGLLKQPQAVDPLLAMLKDPEKEGLHRDAVEALGRIGDPRAVGVLVQRLQNDTSTGNWWRSSAEIQALARIGTDESIAAAETYLRNITDESRFFSMASGYLRARPSDKVVGMIRDRFRNNPNGNGLWSAVWGLRNAGSPAAVTTLEEIARDATNESVRNSAQRYLEERRKLAEQQAALADD
jgi:hypothetical protein